MRITAISAGNMMGSGQSSVSLRLARDFLSFCGGKGEIADLRDFALSPCDGCGACFQLGRCGKDEAFNHLYQMLLGSDGLVIVAPHYAPIPAKLCMVLEKLEQLVFLHWGRDQAYKGELHGLPCAIVSHGGGGAWAEDSYRQLVNDGIYNAAATIQLQTVDAEREGDHGLALGLASSTFVEGQPFPIQRYDWPALDGRLRAYAARFIAAIEQRGG